MADMAFVFSRLISKEPKEIPKEISLEDS